MPFSFTVQIIISPSGVNIVVVSANAVVVANNNDISSNLIITLLYFVLTYIPGHRDDPLFSVRHICDVR